MIRRLISKLSIIARNKEFRGALVKGVGAGVEHMAVLRTIAPSFVVDVGANKGQFSLCVRAIHPNARILAFEPLAEPANIFRAVFSNIPSIELHQVAIGPYDGTTRMNISARMDSSSLLPIGNEQITNFPGTEQRRVGEVAIARLDSFIERAAIVAPALLKIDVQGYELEALRGSDRLLQFFQWVYLELSFVELYTGQPLASDVIEYLHDRGFKLRGVFNVSYTKTGRPVQCDCLFESRFG